MISDNWPLSRTTNALHLSSSNGRISSAKSNRSWSRRAEELEANSQKVKQQERRVETAREEHDAEAEQLAKKKSRFDEQQKRLDGELEGLEARRIETKNQRQRIAEQLRVQRTRQTQEIERRKAELETLERCIEHDAQRNIEQERASIATGLADLEQNRAALELERKQLADERSALEQKCLQLEEAQQGLNLDAAASGDSAAQAELKEAREDRSAPRRTTGGCDRTNAFEEQLNNLRAAYEALQGQTAASADAAQYQAQLEEVVGERNALAVRIAGLEQALAEANVGHSESAALLSEREELRSWRRRRRN